MSRILLKKHRKMLWFSILLDMIKKIDWIKEKVSKKFRLSREATVEI